MQRSTAVGLERLHAGLARLYAVKNPQNGIQFLVKCCVQQLLHHLADQWLCHLQAQKVASTMCGTGKLLVWPPALHVLCFWKVQRELSLGQKRKRVSAWLHIA